MIYSSTRSGCTVKILNIFKSLLDFRISSTNVTCFQQGHGHSMKPQTKVLLGSDQYEEKVIRSAFAQWQNKNRDSERSRCQSGLQIILLCFTQNSTCDSWKGFSGQLSAPAPDNTHKTGWHKPARGRRHRDKDVREERDPCRTVLWTKLCARCVLAAFAFICRPILPLCGWALAGAHQPFVLDACPWPRGMMGNRGGSKIPTMLVRSRFWDNRTAGSRDGSELGTTDSKECRYVCLCRWGVCVCVLMSVYECFWGAGIGTASLLPDSLHMSIPVCLGSPASSTNRLKGITGYLTGRYRRDQSRRWKGSDSTWMRLTVLKGQSNSKWKGSHNSDVYLAQSNLWYSICSLCSASSLFQALLNCKKCANTCTTSDGQEIETTLQNPCKLSAIADGVYVSRHDATFLIWLLFL